eukprot:1772334-Rhodomonas_salina.1
MAAVTSRSRFSEWQIVTVPEVYWQTHGDARQAWGSRRVSGSGSGPQGRAKVRGDEHRRKSDSASSFSLQSPGI